MNSFRDIDEGLNSFEEGRQRADDEHRLADMHWELTSFLKSSCRREIGIARIDSVVLTGDRTHQNGLRGPADYTSGVIEFRGWLELTRSVAPGPIKWILRWSPEEGADVRPIED